MSEPARERQVSPRDRTTAAIAPQLRLGQVIPSFALSYAGGKVARPVDYKGRRNLVLFFMHSVDCPACRNRLSDFAGQYREYQDLEAEVLAIAPGAQAQVDSLARQLSLPFPLLADVSGSVVQRYIGRLHDEEGVTGIFVTDRYGALYYQKLAVQDGDLPDQSQVQGWLLFIDIQCDECGVPEWPART